MQPALHYFYSSNTISVVCTVQEVLGKYIKYIMPQWNTSEKGQGPGDPVNHVNTSINTYAHNWINNWTHTSVVIIWVTTN